MRWNIKRSKLIFALLPILAMTFYILTANSAIFADQAYVAIDINASINDVMTPAENSAPADYDARENFAIAAGVINAAPFYSSETTGTVVASLMNYTQNVANYKHVQGGKVFAESISLSTFASVAEQKYFSNGYIMYRQAKTRSGKVVSWPDEVKEMDKSVYTQKYGVIPREITKYSVTASSYIGGELVESDGNTFTYKMILNGQEAQKYAMREMMTYAGVSSEPKFKTCELTYTIDKNWRILKLDSLDVYDIDIMGGTTCTSRLSETYDYVTDSFPERAQILLDYTPTGDTADIVVEKSAADYLNEGFGDYITGAKNLNLSATLVANGLHLDLDATIDIAGMNMAFALGDRVYAAYSNNTLYFDADGTRGKIKMLDLLSFAGKIGIKLDDVNIDTGDGDLLGKLFENTEIEQTDTHVIIPMIFELMGIDFDVKLNLLKNEDGKTSAESITATVDASALLGMPFVADANVTLHDSTSLSMPDDKQYTDYAPLLNALAGTVTAQRHDIDATLTVSDSVKGSSLTAGIDASIVNNNGLTASAAITAFGQTVNAAYDSQAVYAKIGNIKVKANSGDLSDIIASVCNVAGVDMSGAGVSVTDTLRTVMPYLLPADLSLGTVVDVLSSVTYSDGVLSVFTLPANGGKITVRLTHDNKCITGLTLDGLSFDDTEISAEIKINSVAKSAPVTVADADSYVDIKLITDLLGTRGYTFDIDDITVNAGAYTASVSGKAVLSLGKTTDVLADLYVSAFDKTGKPVLSDLKVQIGYIDDVIYLTVANFSVKALRAEGIEGLVKAINDAKNKYASPQDTASGETADVLKSVLDALGLQGETLVDILCSAIDSVTALENTADGIRLAISTPKTVLKLTLGTKDNKIVSLNIDELRYGDSVSVSAGMRVSLAETAPSLSPAAANYIDAKDLIAFIDPIMKLVYSDSYVLSAQLNVTDGGGATETVTVRNLRINRAGGIELDGSIEVGDISIEFLLKDDIMYAAVGNIMLKARLSDLPSMLSQITALVGTNVSLSSDAVQDLLQKVLPALTVDGITGLIGGMQIDGSTLTLPVTPADGNAYTVTVTADGDVNLRVDGLSVSGYTLELSAKVVGEGELHDIGLKNGMTDADFADVNALTQFIEPITKLIGDRTYTLTIASGTLNTAVISGEYSGTVTLARKDITDGNVKIGETFAVQAQLTLRTKTATHKINITYYGDTQTAYININNIYVSFRVDDLQSMIEQITHYARQGISEAQTASMIQAVSGGSILSNLLGGMQLSEVINIVRELSVTEDGRLMLLASYGEADITAVLGASGDGLSVDVTSLSYNGIIYDTTLFAKIDSSVAASDIIVADQSKYVNLADLAAYIDPVMNTVDEQYYTVSFGGTVTANDKITTIADSGVLRVTPTRELANIYLNIELSDGSASHRVQLYVIDAREYTDVVNADGTTATTVSGDIEAYVNYNDFKVRIDYTTALRIVGTFTDILAIDIPTLDGLLEGIYEPIADTGIFESMDIAGLDGLKKMLTDLFATAEEVEDAATGSSGISGLLGFISEDMIDKALKGLSLEYVDGIDENVPGVLRIMIDNGIFQAVNSGKHAVIEIVHNGEYLTDVNISNLIVNGDNVQFHAALSCEEFAPITAPADSYLDFNSIDELLYSLINTANMREFEITGSINLSLVGLIKPSVPFNVKVKVLDDGSTVAAVKLEVPFVSWGFGVALTRSDSYIYYANNRLYFVVDVWNSWAWSAGSYSYTDIKSATVEEFLANPFDYLFYLLRMGSIIEDPIRDAINKGSSPSGQLDLKNILKSFTFDGNNYNLKLGLAELAGNNDLSDLNLTVNTDQNYITGLNVSTSFVSAVDLSLGNGAKLSNIKYENGKPIGANPVSAVSYGRKYSSGRTGTIESVEDDLAAVFPVEAAIDFAGKTDKFAAAATNAAKNADDSVSAVADYQAEVDAAKQDYLQAEEKLAAMTEGTFGYTRALSVRDATLTHYNRTVTDLNAALSRRSTTAQAAIAAAKRVHSMCGKTAQIAEVAANLNTVAGSGAAGTAATAAVEGYVSAEKALRSAIAAAEAAGDVVTAQEAQDELDALLSGRAANAAKAFAAAIKGAEHTSGIVTTRANEAQSAQATGNAETAAIKANETISAINALNDCVSASLTAAQMTQNADNVSAAQSAVAAAAETQAANADKACDAAVFAANRYTDNIVSQSAAIDAMSLSDLNAVNAAAANTLNEISLADKALETVYLAVDLITDENALSTATDTAKKLEAAKLTAGTSLTSAMYNVAQSALTQAIQKSADYGSLNAAFDLGNTLVAAIENIVDSARLNKNETTTAQAQAARAMSQQYLINVIPASAATINTYAKTTVADKVNAAIYTADNAKWELVVTSVILKYYSYYLKPLCAPAEALATVSTESNDVLTLIEKLHIAAEKVAGIMAAEDAPSIAAPLRDAILGDNGTIATLNLLKSYNSLLNDSALRVRALAASAPETDLGKRIYTYDRDNAYASCDAATAKIAENNALYATAADSANTILAYVNSYMSNGALQ